ncbi:hypothetical protein BB558_002258, partial [Smittium angustum]
MPLLNKNKIEIIQRNDLQAEVNNTENLWKIRFTGELFTDYSEYLKRLQLYRQPIWECEITGEENLTYEQALTKEKEAVPKNKDYFSPDLSKSYLNKLLKMANNQKGTIEDLINSLSEKLRFKFDPNEIVQVKLHKTTPTVKGIIIKAVKSSEDLEKKSSTPTKKRDSEGKDSKRNSLSLASQPPTEEEIEALKSQEYVVKTIHKTTGVLSEETLVLGSQISRSNEVFSKKALKVLLRLCGTKEARPNSKYIVRPYLRAKYNIYLPGNVKQVPDDDENERKLIELATLAESNVTKIKKNKGEKNSKGSKEDKKINQTYLTNLNNMLAVNGKIPEGASNKKPFIKLERPISEKPKPTVHPEDPLKVKLSNIKRFPIEDLELIQYKYLIEKKGLLSLLESEWSKKTNPDKRKSTGSIHEPVKKQLKLSSSGTLELVRVSSNELHDGSSMNPQNGVQNNKGDTKIVENHSFTQWPIPQILWKVDQHLIDSVMQTFVFFSWYGKPLQLNGFLLDQYEVMIGHGLGAEQSDDLMGNSAAVPECRLFSSCMVSLLNIIINDYQEEGPVLEIFSDRSKQLLSLTGKSNKFWDSIIDIESESEKPETMDVDIVENDQLSDLNVESEEDDEHITTN